MDRVRLGRALGVGTRHAARALLEVAEAATAPSPTAPSPSAPSPSAPSPTNSPAAPAAARPTTQPPAPHPPTPAAAPRDARQHLRSTAAGVRQGSKRFGESVGSRFVKLSGVLWLEVTGVFFGLFALTAAVEVWKRRADLSAAGPAHTHLLFAVAMLAVFGYFTVSSFVRASRRGRR